MLKSSSHALMVALLIALGGCRHPQPGAAASATSVKDAEPLPSAAFLAALPAGEEKRSFIIDCTGCHTFHGGIAYPGDTARSRAGWQQAIARMIGFAGAHSQFPVISAGRDPAGTAAWLHEALHARSKIAWSWLPVLERRAEIREYELPTPQDLPHDVAIDGGRVVITGMFTGQMYVLDPGTGAVARHPTPAPNPRAVEIDAHGNWWVVLGSPKQIARRTPADEWRTFDAGFYAHSIALAQDGGIWVNGHFTHAPELLRRIDPATGATRDYEVPPHPAFTTTTVPYELRAGPGGDIWLSELAGNRIARYDPVAGAFKTWTMPTTFAGPRRFDIDNTGVLWIPEYGANRLARFDPRTETFAEYELPLKDTAPYIARWDARRGVVWIGTGAADAVFRFDPRTRRFTYYRLPSHDMLVRHLAVDPATGDVWLAPGAAPGRTSARVIRLRPAD